MLKIPDNQIKEWNNEFDRLHFYNKTDEVDRQTYIAYCAAMWGYTQGIVAMQSIFATDPDWS